MLRAAAIFYGRIEKSSVAHAERTYRKLAACFFQSSTAAAFFSSGYRCFAGAFALSLAFAAGGLRLKVCLLAIEE
jgi:hypothetical protein